MMGASDSNYPTYQASEKRLNRARFFALSLKCMKYNEWSHYLSLGFCAHATITGPNGQRCNLGTRRARLRGATVPTLYTLI